MIHDKINTRFPYFCYAFLKYGLPSWTFDISEDIIYFVKISIYRIKPEVSKSERNSPAILKAQKRQTTFWKFQDLGNSRTREIL